MTCIIENKLPLMLILNSGVHTVHLIIIILLYIINSSLFVQIAPPIVDKWPTCFHIELTL